ncbi:MAG: ABC transporter permease, partial [Pseudomonadota bacterium]
MNVEQGRADGDGGRHYVNPDPFNPKALETLTPEQEQYFQASQWQIMWWKFRRHRIAVWSAWILLIFYLLVPFAEVVAPYGPNQRSAQHLYAPPQVVRLFHEGSFVGPFVYGYTSTLNLEKFRREFSED